MPHTYLKGSKVFCFHSSSDLYGASRIFLQTVKILKQAGYEPIVFLSGTGLLSEHFEENNILVHFIRLGVLRRKYFNLWGMLNRAYYNIIAVFKIVLLALKHKPLFFYNNSSSILSAAVAAKLSRFDHLWHIHEIILKPKFFAKALSWFFEKFSTKCIVVSKATFESWVGFNPNLKRKDKMTILYNGLPKATFSGQSEVDRQAFLKKHGVDVRAKSIVVGTIGRIHPWKGQSYFLEIASKLMTSAEHVIFLIAGDAFPGNEYLYKQLDEQIEGLGLEKRAFRIGYIQHPPEFFNALDIFVLPSILPDPLPTVVLEAMQHKLPVVATNHGGAQEMVVHSETGFLIPWNDANEASQLVGKLIKDEKLRLKMGECGYTRVNEYFSECRYVKSFLHLIQSF